MIDRGAPCHLEIDQDGEPALAGDRFRVCGKYLKVHDGPKDGVPTRLITEGEACVIADDIGVGHFTRDEDGCVWYYRDGAIHPGVDGGRDDDGESDNPGPTEHVAPPIVHPYRRTL